MENEYEATPSDKSLNRYKRNKSLHCSMGKQWVSTAIDWYGESKVLKLINFLKINKDRYNDIHSKNIGYNAAGAPLLIDYSGWRD